MPLDWQAESAIASIVSAMAIVAGTIFVVYQLRQEAKDRYFEITQHLFEIWQTSEFQDDQLFLLHKLPSVSWNSFVSTGRGERAERALHRVGGYYDRVGSLIERRLIDPESILPTIGGYAIAVWDKIEPLVEEVRKRENAFLFYYFEQMLPECRECYVPSIREYKVPRSEMPAVDLVEPLELDKLMKQRETVALDVSKSTNGLKIRGAIRAQPNELSGWLAVLEAGKPVVVYCH